MKKVNVIAEQVRVAEDFLDYKLAVVDNELEVECVYELARHARTFSLLLHDLGGIFGFAVVSLLQHPRLPLHTPQ